MVSPPLKRAVQRAVTVHDDETEPLVVLEQLVQRLQVHLVGNHKAGDEPRKTRAFRALREQQRGDRNKIKIGQTHI